MNEKHTTVAPARDGPGTVRPRAASGSSVKIVPLAHAPLRSASHALDDERADHHNLEHHEETRLIRDVPFILQKIQCGDRRDVHHDEQPRRGAREERLEVDAADDRV